MRLATVRGALVAGLFAVGMLSAPVGATAAAAMGPAPLSLDPCPPDDATQDAAVECIIVPNVVGLEAEPALAALDNAGLAGTFAEPAASDSVVDNQDPAAGDSVTPGSVITLKMRPVSSPDPGSDPVIVPNVVGGTVEDASRIVDGRLKIVTNGSGQDVVIDQDPQPGAEVDAGSDLILTLKSATINVTVPDFRGKSRPDAIALAEGVPLVLVGDDGPDSDVVKTQDPPPGEEVPAQTDVRVAFGPVSPNQPATPPAEPGQSPPSTPVASSPASPAPSVVATQPTTDPADAQASDPATWTWLMVTAAVVASTGLAAAGVWAIRRLRGRGTPPGPPQPPFHLEPDRGRSAVRTEQVDIDAPNYIVEIVPRRGSGVTTIEEHQ